jgi:ATP-dependent protease HslVU (ClpYQ) peptidase subunit
MTCIVGVVHENNVYIAGDSAGVAGYSMMVRADEKVFKKGEFLMGFTTSFRMGQLLRYKMDIPYHKPGVDTYEYMVTEFVEAARKCLKDGGFTRTESGEEFGGTFLVGYRGELFRIEGDFQVGKTLEKFDAVGCGHAIATGSLYSTKLSRQPVDRVIEALKASEQFSAGVRAPFNVVSTLDSDEK